jgi:MFS family permease
MLCQLGLAYGFVLSPLAGAMIDELGWSRAEYGTARSVQLIGMALATPVAGFLLVRFGARPVAFVSAGVMGLAVFGMSRVETLWQFMALTALLGVGLAGIGDVTMGAAVARWVEQGRGKALGFVYMGSNLGGFVFAPVTAWLAASVGWRESLVWLAIGGGLVLVPLGASLIREPRADEAPGAVSVAGASPRVGGDLDLRAALRTRSFWILAYVLFAMFFFYLAMNTHLVLFFENVGLDNQTATGWYGAAIGMGFAIKLVSGFVADQMSPKRVILLDQGLFTAAALVVLLVPVPGFLQVFVVTYGICTAARDVAVPLAVAHCFGSKYMAEIYGVLTLTLLPGGFLGPIFAGAVADRTGSYDTAFVCFAGLNLLGLLSLFGLRREVPE